MIQSDTVYHSEHFENLEASGISLTDNSFTKCIFTKCNLSRAHFDNCQFEDCIFEGCDLSMFTYSDVGFNRVCVKNSRAVGVSWAEMLLPFSVRFENSDISYGGFYGRTIKKAHFIDCIAEETDFSECDITQGNFSGTDLKSAQFHNSRLSQCNFEMARNYTIDIRHNTIDGAKFSLPEALSFYTVLNIDVLNIESYR